MTLETLLSQYNYAAATWDEMHDGTTIRQQYQKIFSVFHHLDVASLQEKEKIASELFMNQGITFTVYSDNEGIERIFPFDLIPRVITSREWDNISTGIQQRLKALNLFLKDIY